MKEGQKEIKESRCYHSAADKSCLTFCNLMECVWVEGHGGNKRNDEDLKEEHGAEEVDAGREGNIYGDSIFSSVSDSDSAPPFLSSSFSSHTPAQRHTQTHSDTLGVCLKPPQLEAVWV